MCENPLYGFIHDAAFSRLIDEYLDTLEKELQKTNYEAWAQL
jgi:hypothetical protein